MYIYGTHTKNSKEFREFLEFGEAEHPKRLRREVEHVCKDIPNMCGSVIVFLCERGVPGFLASVIFYKMLLTVPSMLERKFNDPEASWDPADVELVLKCAWVVAREWILEEMPYAWFRKNFEVWGNDSI